MKKKIILKYLKSPDMIVFDTISSSELPVMYLSVLITAGSQSACSNLESSTQPKIKPILVAGPA